MDKSCCLKNIFACLLIEKSCANKNGKKICSFGKHNKKKTCRRNKSVCNLNFLNKVRYTSLRTVCQLTVYLTDIQFCSIAVISRTSSIIVCNVYSIQTDLVASHLSCLLCQTCKTKNLRFSYCLVFTFIFFLLFPIFSD